MASFSTDLPMAGYVIYRETRAGEPVDPTLPPVFFPPKDSDELFDALRAKFPHVKTHSERMRDAIIEFLLEERQSERSQASPAAAISSTAATSPWQQSWPSVTASTLSSPETCSITTPSFATSPQSHSRPTPMSRQFSTSTSFQSSEPSPPALEQMTSVFSLSSTEQPKQRIRRKMTEAEKVEYRKRRIVKACDKCSKRKRKCHHNEPDMQCIATKPQKVTKSTFATRKPTIELSQPPPTVDQIIQIRDDLDLAETWFNERQPFDDFTTLLQDPVLDPFEFLQPDPLYNTQPWEWSSSTDFTLLDDHNPMIDYGMVSSSSDGSCQQSPTLDFGQSFTSEESSPLSSPFSQRYPVSHPIHDFGRPSQSEHLRVNANIEAQPSCAGLLDTSLDTGASQLLDVGVVSGTVQYGHVPGNAEGVHMESILPDVRSRSSAAHIPFPNNPTVVSDGYSYGSSDGLSQTIPSREGQSDAGLFDGRPPDMESSSTLPAPNVSIGSAALRLTGTARALRAFGNLLNPHSPSHARLRTFSTGRLVSQAAVPAVLQYVNSDESGGILPSSSDTLGLRGSLANRAYGTASTGRVSHRTWNTGSSGGSVSTELPSLSGIPGTVRLGDTGDTTTTLRAGSNVSRQEQQRTGLVSTSPNVTAPNAKDVSLGGSSLDGVAVPVRDIGLFRTRLFTPVRLERPAPTPLLQTIAPTPLLQVIPPTTPVEDAGERALSVRHQRIVTDNYTAPGLSFTTAPNFTDEPGAIRQLDEQKILATPPALKWLALVISIVAFVAVAAVIKLCTAANTVLTPSVVLLALLCPAATAPATESKHLSRRIAPASVSSLWRHSARLFSTVLAH